MNRTSPKKCSSSNVPRTGIQKIKVGRIYRLQFPLTNTSATNADWLKDESHIRPPGVQTPDTERVSTKPPDTVRVSAQSGQGRGVGEKEKRGKGENSRDVVCLKAL
jgi:hypothetical protein